jgi:hypothetical protein
VDIKESVGKAEQFANAAFNAATETLLKESQEQIAQVRGQTAARGILVSGFTVQAIAKIHGARIKKMIQAKLDAFLEGYELYGVQLDDQLINNLINNLMDLRGLLAQQAGRVLPVMTENAPANLHQAYSQMVDTESLVSMNLLRVQVERRRLMPKKGDDSQTRVTNVYHVTGEGARLNVNSTDNSINVISTSKEEIFTAMKAEINSRVSDDRQKEILERLSSLEQAQNSPDFVQRYFDFVGAAANHMTVIAPFIPALTEMLHQALP